MCYYRFAWCVLLVAGIASRATGDSRSSKSTISHHQSASSDESFTPLSLYGGSLFPADVSGDEQAPFAPTLPVPEKQVLELGGEPAAVTGRTGTRSQPQADVEHLNPAAQKIYPTFFRNIPPLGHSRPYYQSTEAAIEQRFNKLRSGGVAAAPVPLPEVVASPLLGSGDFSIIKGGTFYYDTDVPGKGFVDEYYGLGYSGNNGHGRPQLAYLVQKPQKEEQFSNFRDFADINISNDPAYSHHAPLYMGMDGRGKLAIPPPSSVAPATVPESSTADPAVKREPDNILDELRSLDAAPDSKGRLRSKAKKETLLERKKRPKYGKSVKSAAEPPEGEDYMVAAS
ncbi:uncharacterized protein LOC120906857 [Anopheles arabiensis]|uniref:DUF4794 domain-containing protein n=1 Tax=Anopheles arabiensis TaxID=7173 RepID=A0A8W7MTZ5_ANOAR|nr:uncharacterized protein LOC120906857 [Anopheles arabiensis]